MRTHHVSNFFGATLGALDFGDPTVLMVMFVILVLFSFVILLIMGTLALLLISMLPKKLPCSD